MNLDKCIIFDMDGVLINSEPLHFEFESVLFQSLDIIVSQELHETFVGINSRTMWTIIKKTFELSQSVSDLISMEREGLLNFFKRHDLHPIHGITELLSKIKHSGFRLAIASSSPHEQINFILNSCGLYEYFPVRISGDDVKNGKPDPEIFLKAAELTEVKPENCLVIEDSTNGVNAAILAGMKCIGYRNPDSGNQDLKAADLIIDSFDRLTVALVEGLFV